MIDVDQHRCKAMKDERGASEAERRQRGERGGSSVDRYLKSKIE